MQVVLPILRLAFAVAAFVAAHEVRAAAQPNAPASAQRFLIVDPFMPDEPAPGPYGPETSVLHRDLLVDPFGPEMFFRLEDPFVDRFVGGPAPARDLIVDPMGTDCDCRSAESDALVDPFTRPTPAPKLALAGDLLIDPFRNGPDRPSSARDALVDPFAREFRRPKARDVTLVDPFEY